MENSSILDISNLDSSLLKLSLSDSEVQERKREGKVNLPYKAKTKSLSDIFYHNVFTLFNILNIFFAVLVIILAFRNFSAIFNLTFMGLVVFNTLVGIYQEIKAKKTLDKLSLLVESKVSVLRNGKVSEIFDTELVEGDICLLRAGQVLSFDAVVEQAHFFEIDESILTGESNSIYKKDGDIILSGSQVIAGLSWVRVTAVGQSTYMAKLGDILVSSGTVKSQIMSALNRIVKVLSLILLPLGVLLFLSQYYFNIRIVSENFVDIDRLILSTIAALIGMIPEGLILLTSISFAVSVTRLGLKHQMLVQTLPAVETLARVNALCLDKTGTLTTGNMLFEGLLDKDQLFSSTKDGFSLIDLQKDFVDKEDSWALRSSIWAQSSQNATQSALERFFVKKDSLWKLKAMIAFSSVRKWAAFNFLEKSEISYMLGAPSYILKDDPELLASILPRINYFTTQGYRCLLFVKKLSAIDKNGLFVLPWASVEVIGLLVLSDELRSSARETLKYFYDQGVHTVLISGDDAKTVNALATRIGFHDLSVDISSFKIKASKECVNDFVFEREALDCSDFKSSEITVDELLPYVKKYRIFGRVSPDLKRLLIKTLQESGFFVAMVGDGVNDVAALKEANCSVALANGAEATCKASDFVLLSNDLANLIPSVYEGRRVIHNIENVSTLFLTKTIYSAMLAILFLILPFPFPLIPIQITLISTFTIGLPSFFLALTPNKERVKDNFLGRILYISLPTAIGIVSSLLAHLFFGRFFGLNKFFILQLTPLLIACGGFFLLWQMMRPFNIKKGILYGVCLSSFSFLAFFFQQVFRTSSWFSLFYDFSSIIYLALVCGLLIFLIKIFQYLQNNFHLQTYFKKR